MINLPHLVEAIEAADLPIAVYRTARRLLDLAQPDGTLSLGWAEFQALTGCGHPNSARRHLQQMGDAGLIRWKGGQTVTAQWLIDTQYLRVDAQLLFTHAQQMCMGTQLLRAADEEYAATARDEHEERAASARNDEPERAVDVNERAVTAYAYAPTARTHAASARISRSNCESPIRTRARDGCLVDTNQSNPGDTKQPTNSAPPQSEVQGPNDPTAHAVAAAMLLAVGIGTAKARQLADRYPFEEIRRQIAAWWPEYQAGRARTGLLIKRIEEAWGAPEISAEFRQTDLYRNHRLPSERKPQPALNGFVVFGDGPSWTSDDDHETPEAAPSRSLPDNDPWTLVLREAEFSLRPDMQALLADSRLVRVDDVDGLPHYQVRVGDAKQAGWVENRLGPWLRRTLGSILRRQVLVTVAQPEDVPVEQVAEVEVAI